MSFYFRLGSIAELFEPKTPILLNKKPVTKNKKSKNKRGVFKCQNILDTGIKCNEEFETVISNVKGGITKSCGCYRKQVTFRRLIIHGHSKRDSHTRTYITWEAMLQRCSNPKHIYYHNYGGTGISVCNRWLIFKNFLEDMGERPEGKTIDRIDNNQGYYKENCRWATKKEQLYNRKITKTVLLNNKRFKLIDLYNVFKPNTSYVNVKKRINRNWTVEAALDTNTNQVLLYHVSLTAL